MKREIEIPKNSNLSLSKDRIKIISSIFSLNVLRKIATFYNFSCIFIKLYGLNELNTCRKKVSAIMKFRSNQHDN